MPKRNLVWIAIGALIALLLWKVPATFIRRDALLNHFGPLLDVENQVLKNYVENVDQKQLLHGAIDGMLNRLDPYSQYFDEGEYQQFQKFTEGQFQGIGIEVGPFPSGGVMVVSPIEGSPAFYAGLRSGDRIAEIDGVKADDMPLEKAASLISGKSGTSVTLKIVRPSTSETFTKTIMRNVVTVRTVRGFSRSRAWDWDYIIDPSDRIGYIRISSFEAHTHEQVDVVLKDLLNHQHVRGLIIDLRDDPGGLLDVVVQIANQFITDGLIVSTKGKYTPEHPYLAIPERALPRQFPMAVLVNHGSASASEILAGALKDHHRAVIVGEQTFGKGSVQELRELEDRHGAVKLTVAYYYLPNGERIHGKGSRPTRSSS